VPVQAESHTLIGTRPNFTLRGMAGYLVRRATTGCQACRLDRPLSGCLHCLRAVLS
jgi:hypothetical protein